MDDTRIRKTGRHIPGASWHADPLSPPFHPDLIWASRFVQASLLVPEYRYGRSAARGLPVGFVEAPAARRPGRRAGEAEQAAYLRARKVSRVALAYPDLVRRLRAQLDESGAYHKTMILSVDGSYCSRWGLAHITPRTATVARARRDARLCRPATVPRRVYDAQVFTPEQVRRDPQHPWRQARIFHGGRWRTVRYKEVAPVLWKGATRRQQLRLFVLAPTRYRNRNNHGRDYYYRRPAYLLANDLELPAQTLLQKYFDRWQIEVNHREEKDILGVGQAQVRSELSVPRQPALAVAAYSALLLAGIESYSRQQPVGPTPPPAWYPHKRRYTLNDLVLTLRSELEPTPPEQRSERILECVRSQPTPLQEQPDGQT
ncbi:MAG: hypothetical protein FJX72_00575 [Armatimonadetes bacterium]|nr:hypothetical protein [Armatimonadota bacterium]